MQPVGLPLVVVSVAAPSIPAAAALSAATWPSFSAVATFSLPAPALLPVTAAAALFPVAAATALLPVAAATALLPVGEKSESGQPIGQQHSMLVYSGSTVVRKEAWQT